MIHKDSISLVMKSSQEKTDVDAVSRSSDAPWETDYLPQINAMSSSKVPPVAGIIDSLGFCDRLAPVIQYVSFRGWPSSPCLLEHTDGISCSIW